MSAKNRLQEIFQQERVPIPFYQTRLVGGSPHEPIWVSEVELSTGERILGDECKSKVKAEQSAAEKALAELRLEIPEKVLPPQPTSSEDNRTCLMIDGENLPNLAKVAQSFVRPGLDILIFVGHHHHLSERDYGVPKVLVPTTHANGVDSCMQIYVGIFLETDKYDHYLIGTRDHFGSALVDLVQNSEMPWKAKKADLITTKEHLNKHLA